MIVARLREHIKERAVRVERVLNKKEDKEGQLEQQVGRKLYRDTG